MRISDWSSDVCSSDLGIDTSAPAGDAGIWLIDPYDVDIIAGDAAGTLPTNPFDPVATSVIQDGDINNALDAGSRVRITTGDPGAGAPGDGHNTLFCGVEIQTEASRVRNEWDSTGT